MADATADSRAASDDAAGSVRRWSLAAAACGLTFVVYVLTRAPCIGLDDAPELAYCAAAWSVAHPPGFPAWTALGHLWCAALGFLDVVTALSVLSAACSAVAVGLLCIAIERIARRLAGPAVGVVRAQWAAFAAALCAGFGTTVWQWSNTVEVYALQLLAIVLVLLAVALDPREHPRRVVALAGVGVGLGASNHNLTTVLFLPCALLIAHGLWGPCAAAAQRVAVRRLAAIAAVAAAVFALFHVAMAVRAGGDYRQEFGNPDTLARFWHHVTGGFLGGSYYREDSDPAARAWFYVLLVLRNLWLLAIPATVGAWAAWQRSRAVVLGVAGFLAVSVASNLFRRHVANMDSYLVPAFAVLGVFTALGLVRIVRGRALAVAVAVAAALALQVGLSWRACDRTGYDAGDAVMADFDASTPEGAIVVVTNWDLRMLYELYRTQHGFREDLIVVHSSLKGTNHRSLRVAYPEFFEAVQPEYDAYLEAIAAVDPDYVFTDYFRLETARLQQTFERMIQKVVAVGRAERRPILMDRQTAGFLLEGRVIDQASIQPYGNLLSIGRVPGGPPFQASGAWLDHPFFVHDLCAVAVLDNYVVSAEQIAGFYGATSDPRYEATRAVADRLAERQRAWSAGKPLAPKRR